MGNIETPEGASNGKVTKEDAIVRPAETPISTNADTVATVQEEALVADEMRNEVADGA